MTMASVQKIRPLGTNASGTDVVVSFCLLIHPEFRSSMNNNVQKLVAGSFFLERGCICESGDCFKSFCRQPLVLLSCAQHA